MDFTTPIPAYVTRIVSKADRSDTDSVRTSDDLVRLLHILPDSLLLTCHLALAGLTVCCTTAWNTAPCPVASPGYAIRASGESVS